MLEQLPALLMALVAPLALSLLMASLLLLILALQPLGPVEPKVAMQGRSIFMKQIPIRILMCWQCRNRWIMSSGEAQAGSPRFVCR